MQERVPLLCLQETKIVILDDSFINSMLDAMFQHSFVPADGTRGEILVAW
jgi:hypothetical protein